GDVAAAIDINCAAIPQRGLRDRAGIEKGSRTAGPVKIDAGTVPRNQGTGGVGDGAVNQKNAVEVGADNGALIENRAGCAGLNVNSGVPASDQSTSGVGDDATR